jgi:formylglycine-generating enzyme required for sulfatase activity/tetratricopeptide (TPR) repeat protein
MPHEVFISLSKNNKVIGDAVCAALEAAGIRCWIAHRDVQAGEVWAEKIVEAIESSSIMVLVFSQHANRSQQIVRELELAANLGLVIVPFRIEDIEPSGACAYYLRVPHWLDALTPPMEQHLDKLARTVRAILDAGVEGGSETQPASEHRPPPRVAGAGRGVGAARNREGYALAVDATSAARVMRERFDALRARLADRLSKASRSEERDVLGRVWQYVEGDVIPGDELLAIDKDIRSCDRLLDDGRLDEVVLVSERARTALARLVARIELLEARLRTTAREQEISSAFEARSLQATDNLLGGRRALEEACRQADAGQLDEAAASFRGADEMLLAAAEEHPRLIAEAGEGRVTELISLVLETCRRHGIPEPEDLFDARGLLESGRKRASLGDFDGAAADFREASRSAAPAAETVTSRATAQRHAEEVMTLAAKKHDEVQRLCEEQGIKEPGESVAGREKLAACRAHLAEGDIAAAERDAETSVELQQAALDVAQGAARARDLATEAESKANDALRQVEDYCRTQGLDGRRWLEGGEAALAIGRSKFSAQDFEEAHRSFVAAQESFGKALVWARQGTETRRGAEEAVETLESLKKQAEGLYRAAGAQPDVRISQAAALLASGSNDLRAGHFDRAAATFDLARSMLTKAIEALEDASRRRAASLAAKPATTEAEATARTAMDVATRGFAESGLAESDLLHQGRARLATALSAREQEDFERALTLFREVEQICRSAASEIPRLQEAAQRAGEGQKRARSAAEVAEAARDEAKEKYTQAGLAMPESLQRGVVSLRSGYSALQQAKFKTAIKCFADARRAFGDALAELPVVQGAATADRECRQVELEWRERAKEWGIDAALPTEVMALVDEGRGLAAGGLYGKAIRAFERAAKTLRERCQFRVPKGWEAMDATAGAEGWVTRARDPRTDIIFALVKPGTFLMGAAAPPSSAGAFLHRTPESVRQLLSKLSLRFAQEEDLIRFWRMEQPQHKVVITRPFYLAISPTTEAQWAKGGAEPEPTSRKPKKGFAAVDAIAQRPRSDYPVTDANWYEATRYCERFGYSLPTEAQWEYACRAGAPTDRYGDLIEVAWFSENSGGVLHPVAQKRCNDWGFFDMLGNVWEWCADDYVRYTSAEVVDPCPMKDSPTSSMRGGAYDEGPGRVHAASRSWAAHGFISPRIGFRCTKQL